MEVLKFFYNSWFVICIISVAVGLLVNLIPIRKWVVPESVNGLMKAIKNILTIIAAGMICVSAFIYSIYTSVPDVTGMSLSEARRYLRESHLKDEFLPNLKFDSVSMSSEVVFQSTEPQEIVPRNTSVFLNFVQNGNMTAGVIENSDDRDKDVPIEEQTNTDNTDELNIDNNNDSFQENPTRNPGNNLNLDHQNGIEVNVPNVIGMEQGDAIRTLYMAGLQFQVYLSGSDDFKSDTYYVLDQSDMYGDRVGIGTIVKLELVPDLPDEIVHKDFEYEQDDSSVKNTEELHGFYIYSHSVTYASFYDAATNQVSSPDYLTEKLCQVCFNIIGADDATLSIFMKDCNVGICIDNIAGISEIFINKGNYVLSADYGNYTKVVDVNVTSSGEYLINFN